MTASVRSNTSQYYDAKEATEIKLKSSQPWSYWIDAGRSGYI